MRTCVALVPTFKLLPPFLIPRSVLSPYIFASCIVFNTQKHVSITQLFTEYLVTWLTFISDGISMINDILVELQFMIHLFQMRNVSMQ